MPVREDRVVFGLHARHVVHARTPAARPVGPVGPGAVEPPPLGIGTQRREDAVQPLDIAELPVVGQLDPRQQVGARRGGVVAFEAVGTVGADLAADEAVGMLLGVEVVERPLEREVTVAVAGVHHHEGHVPHEDVAVVGDVEVGRDESRPLLRLADVAHGDPPGMPVHLDLAVVPLPHGCGQDFAGLLEGQRFDPLGPCRAVLVLGYEDLLHISILVGQLIGARRESLSGSRSGSAPQERRRDDHSFHIGSFHVPIGSVHGCGGRSPY